jgi:hypothetical protein
MSVAVDGFRYEMLAELMHSRKDRVVILTTDNTTVEGVSDLMSLGADGKAVRGDEGLSHTAWSTALRIAAAISGPSSSGMPRRSMTSIPSSKFIFLLIEFLEIEKEKRTREEKGTMLQTKICEKVKRCRRWIWSRRWHRKW